MKKGFLRRAAGAAALVLLVHLAGCSIPQAGFADYDVSGFIRALLDSSYLNDNQRLSDLSGRTVADGENSQTTAENAAVRFCNAYGIYPAEDQMAQLDQLMAKVYLGARYSVEDEVKTGQGYTVEVTVYPITNFAGLGERLAAVQETAAQELLQTQPIPLPGNEGGGNGEDSGEDEESWDDEPEPTPTPAPTPSPQEVQRRQVDAVIAFCTEELSHLDYDSTAKTVRLDILQTDAGELQLDLNQIDAIDEAVLPVGSP